jgi:hypothetical protein
MIKDYVFSEVISGYNEDLVIANKPAALLKAKNISMEIQPGTMRKRKGFAILGERTILGMNILGLFNFVDKDKNNIPISAVNLPSNTYAKQIWLSASLSGMTMATEAEEDLITEDGYNLIT